MSRHRKSAATHQESPAAPLANRLHWRELAVLALILLTTVLVYLPSVNGRFLWDDDANVTSPDLQPTAGLFRIWFEFGATQQYYPLLHSAFWLEHRLWGDWPTGYHLVSLLWHLVSVLLVYAILKRLKIPGALLAAAIFALHPVMVETVAWITEQKNTLSTMFYLSSLLLYLRFDESRRRSTYLAALGLFVLAILAKSAVVSLPAALLVIFWWQRGTISWRRDVLPLVPFFLAAGLMGAATCYVEWKHVGAVGADFEFTLLQRFLLAGRAVWFYLGKLLWPANLIFIYPRWDLDPSRWWQWIFPIAAIVLTTALWAVRGRSRSPLAAWLFFCGTLLPMLGLLNQYLFLYTFVSDHFQYVASLGIIALVSGTIGKLLARLPRGPRALATVLCVIVVAALAVMSWNQSGLYVNSIALFEATLDRNPNCWMAENNLGAVLNTDHNVQPAIEHLQASLRLHPKNAPAHVNLGVALAEQGHLAEAIEHFRFSIQLNPAFAPGYSNLGMALAKVGQLPESIKSFETALSSAPNDVRYVNNLAIALADCGRYPEAIDLLQHAVRLQPNDVESHDHLGNVLSRSGKNAQAIEQYRLSTELNPDDAEAHYRLALF